LKLYYIFWTAGEDLPYFASYEHPLNSVYSSVP